MQSVGELTLTDPAYHEIDFSNHNDTYGDTSEFIVADMIGAELDEDDQTPDAQPSEPSAYEDLPDHAVQITWHLPVGERFPLFVPISMKIRNLSCMTPQFSTLFAFKHSGHHPPTVTAARCPT